jgi:putative oxidoreductase
MRLLGNLGTGDDSEGRRLTTGGGSMELATYAINYGDLLARFCLSFVFLWSGISKAYHPAAGKAEIAALGLPYPALLLPLTIGCQICGGLMVLLGFWARLGALALLGFTVIATLLAHGSQGLTGEKRQQQQTTSFEHLAIAGGFILVILHGTGALSVDNLLG